MQNKYNWIPDGPDARDYKYGQRFSKLYLEPLPKRVDLESFCSPVENQGQIGSCTANALVGNLEFLENKNSTLFSNLSRLFVYYNERALEKTVKVDGGAQLRDGIKVLQKFGVCSEESWPYDEKLLFEKPNPKCFEVASHSRISSYERLETLEDMRDCLASGYPFVFGFKVYSSFESKEVALNGKLNLPTTDEEFLGGHAVMAVGYDDSSKRFLVRNSWGDSWGAHGYFTMPYGYLADKELASDFWTIKK